MTSRRRRIGGFRRAATSALLKAATTYILSKPVINSAQSNVGSNYLLDDLTEELEIELSREALSPTMVRTFGNIVLRNNETTGEAGFGTLALFIGPADMAVTDIPDPSQSPHRFVYTETKYQVWLPRTASGIPTGVDDTGLSMTGNGIYRPRARFSKRLRPGDHLFLIGRHFGGTLTEGDTVTWSGEIQVGWRLRG